MKVRWINLTLLILVLLSIIYHVLNVGRQSQFSENLLNEKVDNGNSLVINSDHLQNESPADVIDSTQPGSSSFIQQLESHPDLKLLALELLDGVNLGDAEAKYELAQLLLFCSLSSTGLSDFEKEDYFKLELHQRHNAKCIGISDLKALSYDIEFILSLLSESAESGHLASKYLLRARSSSLALSNEQLYNLFKLADPLIYLWHLESMTNNLDRNGWLLVACDYGMDCSSTGLYWKYFSQFGAVCSLPYTDRENCSEHMSIDDFFLTTKSEQEHIEIYNRYNQLSNILLNSKLLREYLNSTYNTSTKPDN